MAKKKQCNRKELEAATKGYVVAWFAASEAASSATAPQMRKLEAQERKALARMRAAQGRCPRAVVVDELVKYATRGPRL